ncbi:unnamed protein product [Linum trigynum]|uniref:Uncharacterized protein n=1 Tax=Linum trigynum TaxID=586398 RepID=A0AAV2CF26_9ROSI
MSGETAVNPNPVGPNDDARGVPTKPWASLFGISEANRLTYIPPEVIKGGLRMPREVREAGAARWKNCLVGQFLQDPPSLYVLRLLVHGKSRRDPEEVAFLIKAEICFLVTGNVMMRKELEKIGYL